jgi:hypothetical protein
MQKRLRQTNKEFIEAANISANDAYLAVAIRRITGKLLKIPAQELTAELQFEKAITNSKYNDNWDSLLFAMELEQDFNIIIDVDKSAQNADYPNWFYNPNNRSAFYTLEKLFRKLFCSKLSSSSQKNITIGEWIKIMVEKILMPACNPIITPTDWTIETSDQDTEK